MNRNVFSKLFLCSLFITSCTKNDRLPSSLSDSDSNTIEKEEMDLLLKHTKTSYVLGNNELAIINAIGTETKLNYIDSSDFEAFHKGSSNDGYWIIRDVPNLDNRSYKNGESAKISGTICIAKVKDDRTQCHDIDTKKISIQAYFPDGNSEVTQQVVWKKNRKSLQFSYSTPSLDKADANSFAIAIGDLNRSAKDLLKIKGKLLFQIRYFEQRLHRLEHHKKSQRTKIIEKILAGLRGRLAKVNNALDKNPSLLASISIPIQVENNISSPLSFDSQFDDLRIGFNVASGNPIDGESAQVQAQITNFSNDRSPQKLALEGWFNSQLVLEQGDIKLKLGESLSFPISLVNLQSEDSNEFELIVYKVIYEKDKGKVRVQRKEIGRARQEIVVSPDQIAPVWEEPITPSGPIQYSQNFPLISAHVRDEFGRINPSQFKFLIDGHDSLIPLSVEKNDEGRLYKVSAEINPMQEGRYTIELQAQDFADNFANPNPLSRSVVIDRTVPAITIANENNQITNNSNYNLLYIVTDSSPVSAAIKLNGVQIALIDIPQNSQSQFSQPITLTDGANQIEIIATDKAGNISSKEISVSLDAIAPVISNIAPENNSIISSLNFSIAGNVSEALSSLKINDEDVSVDSGLLAFDWMHAAITQGPFHVEIVAIDLAGNQTSLQLDYQIQIEPFLEQLISIDTGENNTIVIRGAAGASTPGTTLEINGGLFNSTTVVSKSDGSFVATLKKTSSVSISATANGTSKSVTLPFNVNTTLSGIVKNSIDGNPLMGVRVSIDGSQGAFVATDANGVFNIVNVPTGNRVITIDGSQIPQDLIGPTTKYFSTNISVNVGINQTNVLEDVIYLTPLVSDGTETPVVNGAASVVTSLHAPGVMLEIPAGAIKFPNGTNSGVVSIMEIPADRTSVPPQEFAIPETVIALEPSGVSFAQPVGLTLPNVNQIPPGVQVVILSKNSIKGLWEIDGVAKVSNDGSSIVTEPGQGITHFSEVYAAPLGPKVAPIGTQDRVGADTFNGALSTQVELPSFKSLGSDIKPALLYKSSWAYPSVAATNMIDVPRNTIQFSPFTVSGRSLFVSSSVSVGGQAWVEPEYIEAQFITEDVTSENFRLIGVPNQSVVSFGIDLSNVSSGLHPYSARYSVKLKQMVLTTQTIRTRKIFGRTKVSQVSSLESRTIDKVFPQDVSGQIFTQNKINSEIGQGWKIAGVPRLYSVNGPRIMAEEADGSIASYGLANTIELVYDSGNSELKAVDLSMWPYVSYVDQTNTLKRADMQSNLTLLNRNIERTNNIGQFYDISLHSFDPNVGACRKYRYNVSFPRDVRGILDLGNGSYYGIDISGAFFESKHDISKTLNQAGNALSTSITFDNGCFFNTGLCPGQVFCQSSKAGSCIKTETAGHWASGSLAIKLHAARVGYQAPEQAISGTICDVPEPSTTPIEFPRTGYQDGTLSQALFNDPINIAKGFGNNVVVVDNGNNMIRSINLSDNTVQRIAGNGQNLDNGDGGLAVNASIFHPLAAVYDADGNLYIATEKGLIRKVDTIGTITRYAGKLPEEGGILTDVAHAEEMIFTRPAGLAVDSINGFLYIADTGNHRIVKVDLATKIAQVVAGNGTCTQTMQNGGAAINASLCSPKDIGVDSDGNLIIADAGHHSIRRVIFNESQTGVLTYEPSQKDNSKLYRYNDLTFSREFRNGIVAYFDAEGKCTSIIDKVGRETQFNYDSEGRLISQVDPVGQTITYEYSGNLLSKITDPIGRKTSFDYQGNKLIGVEFPDGATKFFGYDNDGLMIEETDTLGHTTEYIYNEFGRLYSVKRADNSEIIVNDSTSQTMVNNFIGGNSGQLRSYGIQQGQASDGIVDAKDVETKFVRDLNGYVSKIVDGTGAVTEVTRNADGKPTLIKRPDNSTVEMVYDVVTGDMISFTDTSSGKISQSTYDFFGNEIVSIRGALRSEKIFNADKNLLTSEKDPTGIVTTYAYNNLGLPISSVTPIGDGVNYTRNYEYDELGLLVRETSSDNVDRRYQRDAVGNIIAVIDVRGTNDNLVTRFEYDLFNRLTKVTNPKNEVTTYSYLNNGNLERVLNPTGQTMSFVYDNLNRVIEKHDFSGRVFKYAYDSNDNIVQIEEPGARIKTFQYDTLNRVNKKVLPDDTYEYAYDIRGNLALAKNKNSQVIITNDVLGRVNSTTVTGLGEMVNYPTIALSYIYNLNDQRVKMMDSYGGITNYSYFSNGRFQSLTNHNGEVFSYDYTSVGQTSKISKPGIESQFSYDGLQRLSSIQHISSGQVKQFFTFTRNNLGMSTSITSNDGIESSSYDQNNYLSSHTQPTSRLPAGSSFSNETFEYDSLGNRISDQRGSIIYDDAKQLITEDYRYTYFHDENGNLNMKIEKGSGEVTKYSYSSENQLSKVSYLPNIMAAVPTKTINYYYDALGRRMSKIVNTAAVPNDRTQTFQRYFAYDQNEIFMEFNESSLIARYTHSSLRTDDVLAVDVTPAGVTDGLATSAGSYMYLKDDIGTVRSIANSQGSIVQKFVYSAYGIILAIRNASDADITNNPVVKTSFTFTGREMDWESGLYYYRARYYDASIGRFLQMDLDPGRTSVPISVVNKYIYTGNNPINRTDPSGASWFGDVLGVAIGAVAILSGVGLLAGAYVTLGAAVAASAAAVGATALGSAVAAAGFAAFQDGNFGENFRNNFKSFFTVSVSFLVLGAIFAPGGVSSIGANTWYQGGIQSAGGSGGLTIGTASVYSSGLATHEAVHSLIFMGSSVVAGVAGANHPDSVWGLYGFTGLIGLPYGGPGTGDINWF